MDDFTLTALTKLQIAELQEQHPDLPADYLAFMENFGWGKLVNGRMLYSGPIHPDEVYGDALSGSPILLLGDDTCGYCFGYHSVDKNYGELSPGGIWEAWDTSRSFTDYVSTN